MTNQLLGYTNRANVEGQIGQTFPAVSDAQFDTYLKATEAYVNNYLGYNAETTTSGILTESVVREKADGKIDIYGNMVVDLMHPPVHCDAFGNPLITLLEYNVGNIAIQLTLTDPGLTTSRNSFCEVSENRRQVYYPSIYYLPAISSVTPSAKINLYALQDIRFWTDISYIGGYDVVPADIQIACNYICSEIVLQRTNPSFLASFTQGSLTKQFSQRLNSNKGFKVGANIELGNMLLQPYVRNTF